MLVYLVIAAQLLLAVPAMSSAFVASAAQTAGCGGMAPDSHGDHCPCCPDGVTTMADCLVSCTLAAAIPAMLAEAKEKVARGCRIVIYPEGTRKAPLADPDYRQGIVRMYEALGVPVIPVALNSGLYWGRNSLVMWPGTARAEFLPAIMPGLPAPEFAERLKTVIETETTRLIADAVTGLKQIYG